jgi:hypothetical protein
MPDLLASVTSVSWWFSVVVVGILVNLVSAYMKPTLDQVRGRASKRWRDSNAAAKAKFEAHVDQLCRDGDERLYARFDALYYQMWAILWSIGLALQLGMAYVAIRTPDAGSKRLALLSLAGALVAGGGCVHHLRLVESQVAAIAESARRLALGDGHMTDVTQDKTVTR